MPARMLRKLCALDESGERTLEMAMKRMSLSALAYDRVLKVARTIADIDGAASLAAKHIAEAIQFNTAASTGITGIDGARHLPVRPCEVTVSEKL